MCVSLYRTFSVTQIPARIVAQVQADLTRFHIWNRKLVQSGQYLGLKVGIHSQAEWSKCVQIVKKSLQSVEKSKTLKDTVLNTGQADKDQLAILFPDADQQ